MKFNLFLLLFTGFSFILLGQSKPTKLIKTKIDDRITISLPEDLIPMSPQDYVRKYGAYRAPIAIYTDPSGKADLGINTMVNRSLRAKTKSDWTEEDLNVLKGMYKASIGAMHASVGFLQDKIEVINKRKYIVLEFIGTIRDLDDEGRPMGSQEIKRYSYIQYAVEDKQIFVFNFSCPNSMRSYWQNTTKEMMQSLKLGKE
jgi:hypothetical protein